MTDQEKQVELSRLVRAAEDALTAAERFADEHKLSFSWSPFYGGGGEYEGDSELRNRRWRTSEDGWFASSQSC